MEHIVLLKPKDMSNEEKLIKRFKDVTSELRELTNEWYNLPVSNVNKQELWELSAFVYDHLSPEAESLTREFRK